MILISAGHYKEKPGSSYGDFAEHQEAVIWRDILVDMLDGDPVPAGILRNKVEFINSAKPDLAIEIHFNDAINSSGERIGEGSETLYYPGSIKGLRIANLVQSELSKIFGPNRGAKEGWYRMDKRYGPDFFLARTSCVSIIIEPEFVVNAEKIRANRESGCRAIADALRKA